MRKFLISAAVIAAATAAVPASAHNEYRRVHAAPARQIAAELSRLHVRIDRAAARRQLAPGEAIQLQRQHDRLRMLFQHYRRGGLAPWEYREMRQRIADLDWRFRHELRDDRFRDARRWRRW